MTISLENLYVSLLQRLAAAEIVVRHYSNWTSPEEAHLAGRFHVQGSALPVITLFRDHVPFQLDRLSNPAFVQHVVASAGSELEHELVTCAHEYGHFLSWKNGLRAPNYVRAADKLWDRKPVEPAEAILIMEEESRAWDSAESVLKELGYTNEGYLEERKVSGLAAYKEKLQP